MQKIDAIVGIVRDAGGEVLGQTRLQKIAYLLDVMGYGGDFTFVYKHYGPYSEGIADAVEAGTSLGKLNVEKRVAEWGGTYSIYRADEQPNGEIARDERSRLLTLAAEAPAIVLELTATVLFLYKEGCDNPWDETERRKPEKAAGGRLEAAKRLVENLRSINVPEPLPNI